MNTELPTYEFREISTKPTTLERLYRIGELYLHLYGSPDSTGPVEVMQHTFFEDSLAPTLVNPDPDKYPTFALEFDRHNRTKNERASLTPTSIQAVHTTSFARVEGGIVMISTKSRTDPGYKIPTIRLDRSKTYNDSLEEAARIASNMIESLRSRSDEEKWQDNARKIFSENVLSYVETRYSLIGERLRDAVLPITSHDFITGLSSTDNVPIISEVSERLAKAEINLVARLLTITRGPETPDWLVDEVNMIRDLFGEANR